MGEGVWVRWSVGECGEGSGKCVRECGGVWVRWSVCDSVWVCG